MSEKELAVLREMVKKCEIVVINGHYMCPCCWAEQKGPSPIEHSNDCPVKQSKEILGLNRKEN